MDFNLILGCWPRQAFLSTPVKFCVNDYLLFKHATIPPFITSIHHLQNDWALKTKTPESVV